MAEITTILFDLGETLIDFGKVNVGRMFNAGAKLAYNHLRELGQTPPPRIWYFWVNYVAIRWNILKCVITQRDFHATDLMDSLCRFMGLKLSKDDLLRLCWFWYEPLHNFGKVEAGLPEMLRDFTHAGLKLGVVSNTFIPGPILDRHLEEVGLLEYLPFRVYSCDVGWQKPKPIIFRRALELTGSQADKTIFVGDREYNDIYGAKRVGMKTVRKNPDGCRRSAADFKIRKLLELREILREFTTPQPLEETGI